MAKKVIITRKSDDVITNIVNTAETVENGLKVTDDVMGEYIIAFIQECNVYQDIETNSFITPIQYKYTNSNGFVCIGKDIKTIQKQLINQACQNAIINTFQSSAYDGSTLENYDCQLTDQSRINGLVTIAQLRLANLTTEPIKYYKNKEADKCTEWQPKNMLDLGLDLKRHIENNIDRYETLKVYINSLTDLEEVQKVTWDTVIPTTTT